MCLVSNNHTHETPPRFANRVFLAVDSVQGLLCVLDHLLVCGLHLDLPAHESPSVCGALGVNGITSGGVSRGPSAVAEL